MRRSRTSASIAFAIAGLAAAAAGPLAAAPASAAIPSPNPVIVPCLIPVPTTPATDLVKLTGNGVKWGKGGLNAGNEPNCSGTVRWDISNNTIRPTVEGDIILKNSLGVSARLLVAYKDVRGVSLGPARVTQPKVGTTNDEQAFPVTIDGFASPLAYKVEVATQILSGGVWSDVDRESVYLSSTNQPADSVQIPAIGVDFGVAAPLVNGSPPGPGTLTWNLGGNTVTAQLTGRLTMTNSFGVNARMRIKTFDVHGVQLSSRPGGTVTPPSNAETPFAVNLSSFSNPLIFKAQTSIEVEVGQGSGIWSQVGSTVTSYI